jgi:hypothetical protein
MRHMGKIIILFLVSSALLISSVFAANSPTNSNDTFTCIPDPLVPGMGLVVKVFIDNGDASHWVEVTANGKVQETVMCDVDDTGSILKYVGTTATGAILSLTISKTWTGTQGYASVLTGDWASNLACTPSN